ncbi:MAG: hypothetical protein ACRDVL_01170 [Acidimicrobiia bacterium]
MLVALAIGVVFGQVGNFVPSPVPQALLYGLSSIGLTVASALLAVHFASEGRSLVAVGFAILAVSEMLIAVGGIEGAGSHASFAAAAVYYGPALALISIPAGFNRFARVTGALSALAFAGHGGSYLLGNQPASDAPFAIVGYVLLTLTVIGWMADVARRRRLRPS